MPRYSQEQKEWIVDNRYTFPNFSEFLDAFQNQFSDSISLTCVCKILRNKTGDSSMKKTKRRQFYDFEERKEFLEKYYPTTQTRELVKTFNERFGTHYSSESLRDYANYLGLKKEANYHRTNPDVRKPIGHIIKGFIKYKDDPLPRNKTMQNYMPIRKWIYEQKYGAVPKGHLVLAYDGSKDNNDIDNLYCVNKKELLWLTTLGCLGKKEITKAALENIRLEQLLMDKGIVHKPKQNNDLSRLKEWNKEYLKKRKESK